MATNDNIRLVKGSYDLTLETLGVTENIKNTLTIIAPVTVKSDQGGTINLPQVVDLLRISHTFNIEVSITMNGATSAKTIKDNLKTIALGAGTDGGEITMTYEDDTYTGYIEDLVIKKSTNDNTVTQSIADSEEYHATITFVEGEEV